MGSRLSLPLPESEHELVAQQRDALEGEGESSDDIQSLAGDEEGEDREQRERELAAQQRRRAERRARHVVEHQEHEWRQGVMRMLVRGSVVEELKTVAHVRRLGAILHHCRRNNPGDTAAGAPRFLAPEIKLSRIVPQPTDKQYHSLKGSRACLLQGLRGWRSPVAQQRSQQSCVRKRCRL